MKHLNWHHEPSALGKHHHLWTIGLGGVFALLIIGWILYPSGKEPQAVDDQDRGITIAADQQDGESLDLDQATEWLIDAIIQLESQGNADMVGSVGERGLMQIRKSTWRQVTRKHMDGEISFDRAFEPELNRQVGREYLGDLQTFLYANRKQWKSDLRSLLLACYNAGPERVRQSGFNLKRLPKSVQSYAQRGSALHDWYLSGDAEAMHQILIEAAGE